MIRALLWFGSALVASTVGLWRVVTELAQTADGETDPYQSRPEPRRRAPT